MEVQGNDRAIDVVGYLRELWAYKWVWIVVFVVAVGIGAAVTVTRPASWQATQRLFVTLPAVANEGEATQQAAMLEGLTQSYVAIAESTTVTAPVLENHADINGLAGLKQVVTATAVGRLMVEFTAVGSDVAKITALVQDYATSMSAALPRITEPAPAHLRFGGYVTGDPTIVPASSGRTILAVASVLAALLLATCAAALVHNVRGDADA